MWLRLCWVHSRVWLFAVPWTVACQAVHGIFQARGLEWVASSYWGDLPDPRSELALLGFPVLQADSLLLRHWRGPGPSLSSSKTGHSLSNPTPPWAFTSSYAAPAHVRLKNEQMCLPFLPLNLSVVNLNLQGLQPLSLSRQRSYPSPVTTYVLRSQIQAARRESV